MSKPLRVLIVEDSEDDARLLLDELRQGGYEPTYEIIDTAEAMSEALEKQSWDIVIADYVMPGFSGLAALELVKKKDPDLPFIVMSGKIGEEVAVEAMKAGAQDYILKDNLTRLSPAVERELGDAQVRRERRRTEEERDALMNQLRQVNERLVVSTFREKEKAEEVQRLAGQIREVNERLTVASIRCQDSEDEALRLAIKLDATINSIGDGIMIHNKEGEIIRANPASTKMPGYTPADHHRPLIEQMKMLRAETPDGKPFPPEEAPVLRALRGEIVHGVLVVLHPPHRDTLGVSVSASPIVGPDGAMLGAVSTFADVTVLHELQAKTEAYFRAVCPDWQPPSMPGA